MPGARSDASATPSVSPTPPDPYAAARHDMLENQLRRRGIVLLSVLEAMREIPRHLFVGHAYAAEAYADAALPSQDGQTISQPYIVAVMTQELALRPGLHMLEIGTGTGYQTAILAYLVAPAGEVCTIERMPSLAEYARHRLEAMEIRNVRYHIGDGSVGWPPDAGHAPQFDRILITAGTPSVPAPLLNQLADEGILVAPVGSEDSQMLIRLQRHGAVFEQTELLGCRFVPLVGAHAWHA